MGVTVYQPGNVLAYPATGSTSGTEPASLTGSGPIWSDGSTSSYAEFTQHTSSGISAGAWATLPAINWSTAVSAVFRMQVQEATSADSNILATISAASPPPPAFGSVFAQWTMAFTNYVPPQPGIYVPGSTLSGPTIIELTLGYPDFDTIDPALIDIMAAGAARFDVFWESGWVIGSPIGRIYEASFVVTDSMTIDGQQESTRIRFL